MPRKKKEDPFEIPKFLCRTIGRKKIPVVRLWRDGDKLIKEGEDGKFYNAETDKVMKWAPKNI